MKRILWLAAYALMLVSSCGKEKVADENTPKEEAKTVSVSSISLYGPAAEDAPINDPIRMYSALDKDGNALENVFEAYLTLSSGALVVTDQDGSLWKLCDDGTLAPTPGSNTVNALGTLYRMRLDFGEMKWAMTEIQSVSLQPLSDAAAQKLTYAGRGKWTLDEYFRPFKGYSSFFFTVKSGESGALGAWVKGEDGKVLAVGKNDSPETKPFTIDAENSYDNVRLTVDMNGGRTISFEIVPRSVKAIFIGDSITRLWPQTDAAFFRNNGYVGKGIDGQTSRTIRNRFHRDVVENMPYVVHIMCGTNDVAENDGVYVESSAVVSNIAAMAESAVDNGIAVAIGSLLPSIYFYWRGDSWTPSKAGVTIASHIAEINTLLKALCEEKGYTYIDYYSTMADPEDLSLPSKYSNDGCHPELDGFLVMDKLAKPAVDSLLPESLR